MGHRWSVRVLLLCMLTAMLSVAATPAAGQEKNTRQSERASDSADAPQTTLKGRVQSVHEERIVLRTDDGRVVNADLKGIRAEARGLVQVGEPVVLTGSLTGDQLTVRSLTVAASVAGARALAGPPPLTPADAGAASPATESPKRK